MGWKPLWRPWGAHRGFQYAVFPLGLVAVPRVQQCFVCLYHPCPGLGPAAAQLVLCRHQPAWLAALVVAQFKPAVQEGERAEFGKNRTLSRIANYPGRRRLKSTFCSVVPKATIQP